MHWYEAMMRHIRLLTTLFLTCLLACSCSRQELEPCDDYRQSMRDFVVRISMTAKAQNPAVIVIPQNGIELITSGASAQDELAVDYLSAIDGHGQEDLFYGYTRHRGGGRLPLLLADGVEPSQARMAGQAQPPLGWQLQSAVLVF